MARLHDLMPNPTSGSRRRCLAAAMAGLASHALPVRMAHAESAPRVPVLTYHRFAATAADSMTVRDDTFEAHLGVLQALDCRVIPLADLVAYRRGERSDLPPRAVALTADDAHRSQFERMAPMLRPLGWPVTLFVYPSAVSNADYAMTWGQLAELKAGGRYTVESHTYWHPHFLRERQRLAPAEFERFAADQLTRSRDRLQRELGGTVSLLAWPFGLSDAGLMAQARQAGYAAAFSLGNRPATRQQPLYALPRFLVTDSLRPRLLAQLLQAAFASETAP